VASFGDILRGVAARVPEARVLMVIGTDGIPVERLVLVHDPSMEAVAAELTTLLRAGLAAAEDTGLGALQEVSVSSTRMTTLMTAITPEYFLFASLAPGAVLGRARFALKLAGASLLKEFS
jgi:predicted regulator of Ras-like GTPase activity (Roadblock/LC7/MglB family)